MLLVSGEGDRDGDRVLEASLLTEPLLEEDRASILITLFGFNTVSKFEMEI